MAWHRAFAEWVAAQDTGWAVGENVFVNGFPPGIEDGLRIVPVFSERFADPIPVMRQEFDFWFSQGKGDMERGYDRAWDLAAAIDGTTDAHFSDGTIMIVCRAGTPDWMGSENSGRSEWVVSVSADIKAETRWRDGGEGRR